MAVPYTNGRPAGLPLSLLSQAIHRLSRCELEDLAQSLIDHLDALDGDSDGEECDLEDSFVLSSHASGFGGIGCFISDPGGQRDEDEFNTWLNLRRGLGPGCPITDAAAASRRGGGKH